MVSRVYLDTSVFSAHYDEEAPDRRIQTEEFWARRSQFAVSTSELARDELQRTPDSTRRVDLLALLNGLTIHPITDAMRALAVHYIQAWIFSEVMYDDAPYVAAAVLTQQDVLLSWNFRHLVNRRRRAQINDANVSLHLPTIEIVAPPEI
jgi:predicted nucleic acid-binding protein